jgi:hypothetical protein
MVGLGDGAWQPVTLDQTALDHADVQCSDLQTRSWWSATASFALPVETAFSKPVDQFQTIDACIAAQEAGTWPSGASCEDQVLLCPDGRALVSSNDVTMSGHYIAATGELSVEPDSSGFVSFSGTFTSDGAYASTGLVSAASVTWHTTSTFANGMHCQ